MTRESVPIEAPLYPGFYSDGPARNRYHHTLSVDEIWSQRNYEQERKNTARGWFWKVRLRRFIRSNNRVHVVLPPGWLVGDVKHEGRRVILERYKANA